LPEPSKSNYNQITMKFSTIILSISMMATAALAVPNPAPEAAPVALPHYIRSLVERQGCQCLDGEFCCFGEPNAPCYGGC